MSEYYIYNSASNDELMHYGVVGMKWGVRRAAKKGGSYNYTSFGTKRYKRIADRAAKRGNVEKQKKYEQYHKKSVEMDRKMQANATKNSGKRAVLKTLVNGPLGGKTYEAVKVASGNSKYISRAAGTVAGQLTGPFGAAAARALYVRGHDGKSLARGVTRDVKDLFD